MALINITPVMTSNTTPSPYVVTASSVSTDTTYASWKAFNGTLTDSSDAWASAVNITSAYLIFNFGSKVSINAISLYSRYNTTTPDAQMVKSFILYGSNDGISYDYILEKNNEMLWNQCEGRLYKLNNSVCYQYYKIMITSINGSTTIVIGDIKFWQDDGITTYLTNQKASSVQCLPSNTTLAMTQRANDSREGLLGFANDDNNYGTLWMINNKGKAIIPYAKQVNHKELFNGFNGTKLSTITLSDQVTKFRYLYVIASTSSYHMNIGTLIPVKDIVFTSSDAYQYIVSQIATATVYNHIRVVFPTETTIYLLEVLNASWTLGIHKVIGIY